MTPAITYQACPACGNRWWFRREFCPRCGRRPPEDRGSAGQGRVVAATVVHRAPSDAWRPYLPYTIVLVWLDEGLRVMGHADRGVGVGDAVGARLEVRAGSVVPVFSADPTASAAPLPDRRHRAASPSSPDLSGERPGAEAQRTAGAEG